MMPVLIAGIAEDITKIVVSRAIYETLSVEHSSDNKASHGSCSDDSADMGID